MKNRRMKQLLILVLFMLFAGGGFAQRFEGGLIVGYNASQVDGDIYKGYNKPGILAGAYVQTDLAPAIFAGMEIKYSQKGSRNKVDPKAVIPEKYIMRLGYADVPVYLGFRANDRVSVLGGVIFGYLIHAKEYNENGVFVEQDQHKFNNFDLEPFFGFQFDLLDQLKIDLRFSYSVVPIREQPGENATTIYWLNNQFNKVISLSLCYRLNAKKI
jgi:opacity protein-like surface antigen